jgi:hypothetical protein
MVIRPKHVAVTDYNIQTSVALDGNPEPGVIYLQNIGLHAYECNYRKSLKDIREALI